MSEDKVLQKLTNHEAKLERIVQKLVDHEGQLRDINQQMGGVLKREEFHNSMDQVLTILNRIDQEHVVASDRFKRIEDAINRHDKEIGQLKHKLGVS